MHETLLNGKCPDIIGNAGLGLTALKREGDPAALEALWCDEY